MPRGVNTSGLNRQQRLERSFEMFAKGYRNVDVRRRLKISADTCRRYRQLYEEHLQHEVTDNPRMLTDVLGNTVRVIEEIDLVKKDAWGRLDKRQGREHYCEECECHIPLSISEAVALERVILETTQQRMRLFGLLGVKQEYFIHVQRIQLIQAKIIEFLQSELCEDDRRKFERFMAQVIPASLEAPVILDAQSEDVPA